MLTDSYLKATRGNGRGPPRFGIRRNMVGATAGMGLSARLRGAIISAAPMLVLGFTMFVVALNMR